MNQTSKSKVAPDAVRTQLDRILNGRTFGRSPRISRFLTFVVEQTLAGQQSKLKEYLLGVEVFGRLDSFDPRIDSIVRVEARRLRYKLDKYYETEGPNDPVYIQLRKGCYIPSFSAERADGEGGPNCAVQDVPYVRAINDPSTFAHYVRGRHALSQWTAEGISQAVSCFTQALERQPNCSDAHSGLANAWMSASMLGTIRPADVVPKAKSSAQRALAISKSVEAHTILGAIAALYDWDWAEAEQRLRRAIHANPCDTAARIWYGLYLALAGRPEDAVREARRAQQAAPTSVAAHLVMGLACYSGRAHQEALMHCRLAQDLNPSLFAASVALGLLFTDQKMLGRAAEMLNRARELQPECPEILAALAYTHAAAGRSAECRKSIEELSGLSTRQYVSPVTQALAYSAAGDVDAAYRKLDEAVNEHAPWLPLIRFAPAFQRVQQDGRFPALLQAMHL